MSQVRFGYCEATVDGRRQTWGHEYRHIDQWEESRWRKRNRSTAS